ncbi:aryl-sulfate sulfotransferase [candidate division KSB1 bacterium]|nr:aryl-sulfate sulfotransferase [candidate division KSB1 bacterium]
MKRIIVLFLFVTTVAFAQKYHPAIQYIFPLPESENIPQLATIILRVLPEYRSLITGLDNLITVTGEKQYEGETFFATDDVTIIFRPSTRLRRGDKIQVSIAADQFGKSVFQYNFSVVESQMSLTPPPVVVEGHGRPAPTAHTGLRIINGVAVPGDFPVISTIKSGQTAPGKIFFGSHFIDPGYGNYLVICDNNGMPLFYRRYDRALTSGNFTLQPTGVLTAFLNTPTEYIVLDQNYDEIDTYRSGHGYSTNRHEMQLLENGNALMIAEEYLQIDMSQIVDGGRKDALVQANHLQELDRDKNVIFEWRSWDHLNIADAMNEDLTAANIDYVHMNSIAVDYDDNLVVSSRHQNEVTKIDRQTGEIIWRLGGPNNEFEFVNDTWMLSHQHDVRPVPGQPDQYTMFDNGNNRDPEISRVVEFKVIMDRKRVRKMWEYRFEPDRYLYMMGSAQRLDNGNTFIDLSTKSPLTALEVTPGGEQVFAITSYGSSTYRSRRYEWNGKARIPYLIVENLGYVVNLIFNKFGDQDVQYYNINYGTEQNPTKLLALTENTWFQAFGLKNNTRYFFRVTAVDQNGMESDYSNQEEVTVSYVDPGTNMVKNGGFESDNGWTLLTTGDADATGSIDSQGRYQVHIVEADDELSRIQLIQDNCVLLQGQEYLFEFDACADENRIVEGIVENIKTNNNYGKISPTFITKKMDHYSYSFVMVQPSDANARIAFKCGGEPEDVYIDNVSLKQVNNSNVQPDKIASPVPGCTLYANYPNPFNAATEIKYFIPKNMQVRLEVFNKLGQKVAVLIDREQPAGEHRIRFSAGHLVSGIYFCRLTAGGFSQVNKLVLVK